MQAFAQKPKATQKSAAARAAICSRTRFGESHDFSPLHPTLPVNLQAKLRVSTPGDIYELEADRVSEQVMSMPEPQLQSACPCGGGCPKCQGARPNHEHERLRTKRVQAGDTGQKAAPPIVHEVLRSPGQPLDPETRAFIEPRFGHDFSHVRVHDGAAADQSAQDLNANAYTVGHNIVFGAGRFAPATHEGHRLIAHELAHVLQQQTTGTIHFQRQPARNPRWKESVSAARYRGRLMADRIRKHGVLSKEARAKINEELAYFEGAAEEAYAREVKPVLSAVVETEMPAMEARPEPVEPEPAKPERTQQASEYEAMAAYYAGTRESQLEAASVAHAKVREGVHDMTPKQVESQWETEKENFLQVASSPNHTLNKEQLLEIWKLHWGDRWKASQSSLTQIRNLKPDEQLAALKQAESDEASANFMLRSITLAYVFLIAAEDQGKHVTLDELNNAAANLETFHESMVSASGMIVPGGGLGIGRAPRITEPIAATAKSTPTPAPKPSLVPPAAPGSAPRAARQGTKATTHREMEEAVAQQTETVAAKAGGKGRQTPVRTKASTRHEMEEAAAQQTKKITAKTPAKPSDRFEAEETRSTVTSRSDDPTGAKGGGKTPVKTRSDEPDSSKGATRRTEADPKIEPPNSESAELVWVQLKDGRVREYKPSEVTKGQLARGAEVTTAEGSGKVVGRGEAPNAADVKHPNVQPGGAPAATPTLITRDQLNRPVPQGRGATGPTRRLTSEERKTANDTLAALQDVNRGNAAAMSRINHLRPHQHTTGEFAGWWSVDLLANNPGALNRMRLYFRPGKDGLIEAKIRQGH